MPEKNLIPIYFLRISRHNTTTQDVLTDDRDIWLFLRTTAPIFAPNATITWATAAIDRIP